MRAIYFALLAGGAFGGRVKVEEGDFSIEDLKRDITYPGPSPVDTLADIELPEPLTARQRERNRASFVFGLNMLTLKDNDWNVGFCPHSNDDCATLDEWPGRNTHSEMRHVEVAERLPDVPEMEVRGQIRRLGDLGYLIFNDLIWHYDWKTFPIGADLQDHRKGRPIADALMGHDSAAWSREMIRQKAEEFFRGRQSFNPRDLIRWTNKLLHKILLDLDLTDEEEDVFEDYKFYSTEISTLPRWLASVTRWFTGLSWARNTRDDLLEKYQEAMDRDTRGIYVVPTDPRDKRFLADLLLTALTSAGGLSVPTSMGINFAILHGAEFYDSGPVLPNWREFSLTDRNIEQFVLESVRRFPLVVGFPWWNPEMNFRTLLNLAMSSRDPRAWEAPKEFRLRPLSEYHERRGPGTKIGVNWAQQAIGKNGLTPDSRGCPGQELSVVILSEILRAYMPTQHEWSVGVMPSGGIQITEGVSKANDYTLTRNGAAPESIPTSFHSTPAPQSEREAEAEQLADMAAQR